MLSALHYESQKSPMAALKAQQQNDSRLGSNHQVKFLQVSYFLRKNITLFDLLTPRSDGDLAMLTNRDPSPTRPQMLNLLDAL